MAADEITAALPVIPEARFGLADYGAVGDGTVLNADTFQSAVAKDHPVERASKVGIRRIHHDPMRREKY